MARIRYLNVRFANRIMPWEIPYFRAAVIEASERKSSLFHNHAPGKGFLYRYPLIQYKVNDKKASIVCINEGTDDIHYLLQKRHFNFNIKGRRTQFEIEDVHLRYYNIQTWNRKFSYNILNWVPLNQENYMRYKGITVTADRRDFLNNILRGHFYALAGGIDWDIDHGAHAFEARIKHVKSEKFLPIKNQYHLSFHMNIETNVSLPNYIGLGKGVSLGFGIVKRLGDGKKRLYA